MSAEPARFDLISSAPAETERIAARIAARLQVGDVVTVSGELGAGKTTFIRGACRALGVKRPVTSPTYTIGHRYEGPLPVAHVDLYRFEQVSPSDWGTLEPYFDGTIVFVEWPEAAVDWIGRPRVAVRLAHVDSQRRAILLESAEPRLLSGLI
jgi:tRNA threonylcarbamoyladenosine biosynthesis protein TsaE